MIKKIDTIFDKGSFLKFGFLVLGLIILGFTEMIGIGSIPLFISGILKNSDNPFRVNWLNDFIDTGDFLEVSYLIIIIFVIKNFFYLIITYYQGFVLKNTMCQVSNKLFRVYLNSSYEKFINKNSSFLLNNFSNEVGQCFQFLNSFFLIIKELIVIVFLFFLSIFFNFEISLIVFVFLLICSLFYFFIFKNKLNELGLRSIKFKNEFFKILSESFGLIKEIKIYGLNDSFTKTFSNKNYLMYDSQHLRTFITQIPRPILEIFSISGLILLTNFISNRSGLENALPTLALFTIIAIRLIPAFNVISSSIANMKSSYPSLNLIFDEFKLNKITENNVILENQDVIDQKSAIEINDLDYRYNDKHILKNLNISIPKNKLVCLVGKTGSGKSTLIKLILNILKPNKGTINYNRELLYNNRISVGYVPQDVYLIDDTIKSNILLGLNKNEIDPIFFEKILQESQLPIFLKETDKGLDSSVGDKGEKISGGQKQRIGIARALLRSPNLLILDESTSGLDLDTESKIIDALKPLTKDITIIFATHRTWDLKKFDHIFKIECGKCMDLTNEN